VRFEQGITSSHIIVSLLWDMMRVAPESMIYPAGAIGQLKKNTKIYSHGTDILTMPTRPFSNQRVVFSEDGGRIISIVFEGRPEPSLPVYYVHNRVQSIIIKFLPQPPTFRFACIGRATTHYRLLDDPEASEFSIDDRKRILMRFGRSGVEASAWPG